MLILNGKRLLLTNSSEDCARVYGILHENGIPYAINTKRNVSAFRRNLHYNMGMKSFGYGMAASQYGDEMSYVYTIRVRRKDYEKARSLCSLK